MKAVIFIFSAYFIALTMLPCSEVMHDCLVNTGPVAVIELQDQNLPGHSDDPLDHCSPFCVCDCCGISVWTMNTAQQALDRHPAPTSTPSFLQDLFSNPAPQDIWQPPKRS